MVIGWEAGTKSVDLALGTVWDYRSSTASCSDSAAWLTEVPTRTRVSLLPDHLPLGGNQWLRHAGTTSCELSPQKRVRLERAAKASYI